MFLALMSSCCLLLHNDTSRKEGCSYGQALQATEHRAFLLVVLTVSAELVGGNQSGESE